ncbi:MAG: helix-turn-helix transcriptional regulator [Sphingomonas sp.]|nr:helix-turn-helix transcriptional regulator [Sphingomonas sp.]
MGHRRHGCGSRGRFEVKIPEALFAMRGGRGFQGGFGPFHFDFGDGPGGFDGRRGRKSRRMVESGELRLLLLKLIAEEPRHGYDLIKAIEELSGGQYVPSPGVVYPTLTLLLDMGLIEEAPVEGGRKPFEATDAGRQHLEEKETEADAVFDRLADLAPDRDNDPGPAIGRAVKNLMTALSHRIGRDGLDEDLLHEIAAILDEAAQRIERVKTQSA